MLTVLLALAVAAPPDKVAARPTVGGGEIGRLQLASDGGLITGVTSQGHLVVLDTGSWVAERADTTDDGVAAEACTARAAAAVPHTELGWLVYVGCADGAVQTWRWTGTALGPYGNDDAPDGLIAEVSTDPVVALFDLGDDGLWGLTKGASNLAAVRLLTAEGVVSVDASAAVPLALPSGFDQAVVHPIANAPIVSIHHGSGRFSQWAPWTNSLASPVPVGLTASPADLTPSDTALLYFVEKGTGRLGQYNIQGGLASLQYFGANLTAPRTVLFAQDTDVNRFYVEDGTALKVFPVAASGAPEAQFGIGYDGVDMIGGPPGYTVAGTTEGAFAILTANPWVSAMTISPASATTGAAVTVRFSTDEAGSWSLDVDGTRDDEGRRLDAGTLTEAGEAEVTFEVDEELAEGTHTIWARVTAADGAKGSASATLVIDNAPADLTIDPEDVGVGNRQVVLSWSRLGDEDLTGYDVYVSDAPFSREEHLTGGPTGTVGKVTSPVFVEQPASGSQVRVVIDRLVNGRTYWLAVRATDGTNEGPMSNVVSATPIRTCSAAECAGDEGGPPCSTLPGVAAGWGLALVALAALRRRPGAVAAVLTLAALAAPAAQAQDVRAAFQKDETPAWVNFELQFAGFQYSDELLKSAYGASGTAARIEVGLQLYRYGEIDLGVGYMWDRGNTLAPGGGPSAEEARTEWMPLTITGTLRAHVMDEQPLVPYGSIGFSYVFWREAPLDGEGAYRDAQMVTGSKMGWHWGVGGNLLLDVLQPRRASMLEARTGINDTWLTIEYREQRLDPNGGLDLSGWTIGGGLKIDY